MFNFGNALSNIKAKLSPVVDKAKQVGSDLIRTGLVGISPGPQIGVGIGPQNPQLSKQVFSGIRGLTEKIDTGLESLKQKRLAQQKQMVENVPQDYKPTVDLLNKVGNIPPAMTEFGIKTATGLVHDFAYTGEKLSTPEGIQEVVTSAKNLPKTVQEKGFLAALDEPAVIVGLTASNFFTGGETGVAKEIVGKEAAQIVARQATKQAERDLAEQTLKETATNPRVWKSIVAKGADILEPFLNSAVVTRLRDFVSPGASWIEKVPGGREMVNLVIKTHDDAERLMGKYTKQLKPVFKDLTDDEFAQALDVQRGLLKSPNAKVTQAAKALENMFKEFGTTAKDLGVQVRTLTGQKKDFVALKNYVPQRLNLDLLKKNPDLQEALAQYLYDSKQIVDSKVGKEFVAGSGIKKAEKFVSQLVDDVPVRTAFAELFPNNTLPRRMGNLEMERILDLPAELNGVRILDSSKRLITDYIQQASNRLMQVKNFGLNNEVLNKFQKDTAGLEYSKEAVDIIKREFGLEPKSLRQIMNERSASKLRVFQSATKLGTAAISNATQSVNTATSYGIGNTLKAIFGDILKRPQSAEFADDAGIAIESSLRDMASEQLGNAKGFLGKLVAPGFKEIEAFNRRVAANAGKIYSIEKFNKLLNNPADKEAMDALKKFGIDAEKALQAGKLSEDDLITAARRAVDTTQFQVRPIDLPPDFTTTWGKLLFQFKNFGYKQAEFVGKEILAPAFKGNFAPLTRYIATAIIAGEVAADVKYAIRGKERQTDPMLRAWENIQQVGGFGIASDAVRAATTYGSFSNWILGPTVGDVVDLMYEMGQVFRGNLKPLMRDVTQKIPIVGPGVAKNLFPSSNQKKTKVINSGGAFYGPNRLGY